MYRLVQATQQFGDQVFAELFSSSTDSNISLDAVFYARHLLEIAFEKSVFLD
jgi:hypothetical protein